MKIEEILIITFLATLGCNLLHKLSRGDRRWLYVPNGGWRGIVFAVWALATGLSAGASLMNWLPFTAFLLITMGFNIAIQLYSVWARCAKIASKV